MPISLLFALFYLIDTIAGIKILSNALCVRVCVYTQKYMAIFSACYFSIRIFATVDIVDFYSFYGILNPNFFFSFKFLFNKI